jgi:hypothetical protein
VDTLPGKTLSLISRLPAFYEAEQADSLFFQLLNVFGQLIEQSEIDLMQVMRSHHIGTADNEGSQGLASRQQGDLDLLFALYLEALGGTALLTEIEPQFRAGSFKDLPGLLHKLQKGTDRLSRSLVEQFSGQNRQQLLSLTLPLTPSQYQQAETLLTTEFNRCLQDAQWYQRHRQAFALAALTPATQKQIQQAPTQGRALAVFNRALLEAAYANEIEKSYAPYRDRLLALIRVLRRGAATKQGIADIVAANLGIFADDPLSQKAKELIKVEEYLAELIINSVSIHPFATAEAMPVNPSADNQAISFLFPQTFILNNPNPFPTVPSFKWVVQDARLLANAPANLPTDTTDQPTLLPLVNPRLVNLDTQTVFEFKGMLQINDELRILPDGQLFLNGIAIAAQAPPPALPCANSHWHLEASVGEAEGRFDRTLFALSRYDRAKTSVVPLNPQQAVNYAITVTLELTKLNPGTFRVRIPWNIPGFTDKFGEREDHPRTQIPAILNKVKAAGVLAIIDYEQSFTEVHRLIDRLIVEPAPFEVVHDIEETDFDVGAYQAAYPNGTHHEHSDQLLLSGVFDYTAFDSGNRFA